MAWVNGPVLLLIFVPAWTFGELVKRGVIGRQHNGIGLVVFVVGIALAWLWWSLSVPRWRLWAYERVANIPRLKAEAVGYGLTWSDGSVFAKTEIKSATQRRREAELSPDISIVPAGDADVPFAHDLSRNNMSATFAAAGIVWDPTAIPTSWPSTENYLLRDHGERIGILRLRDEADALYVGDLQVAAGHRNRGAGTAALEFSAALAADRDKRCVQLRVFQGSPAIALYRRAGFSVVADEGVKLLMELPLESD
ncbi:MAG TPA: GNAT family N-acetyltransferase [Steroidobacteraceae bacterium]|nr:GNAT family N-acetyltransferase [Steroidobacteraceae bacterium]